MIFCASDRQADMVKRILERLYKKWYGDQYSEAAVKKITDQSDKVN